MANYGYVRISSKDQSLARQYAALKASRIKIKRVYEDVMSGKSFERSGYIRLLETLKPKDTLVVGSLDRLGRNYGEILDNWRLITKEKQADIVVLDMPLLDTRDKEGDLIGTFISDLVLQILSYVAETEREFIRRRQADGIAAAKAAGVRFGRPMKEPPTEFFVAKRAYLEGQVCSREAAGSLGVSQPTFLSWVKKY